MELSAQQPICGGVCGIVFDMLEVKVEHHKLVGLLQLLDVLEWKWDNIFMDFVVSLPITQKKFDSI